MQDGPTWVERQRAKTTEKAKAPPRAKGAQNDQAEAVEIGKSRSKPKGKGGSDDFVERWFRPILITCTILVLIEVAIIVYYA